jgi:hypothetical protein
MNKKDRYKYIAARVLLVVHLVLSGAFALWLFVSWVEIALKNNNLESRPEYSPWNAWVLVSEVTNVQEDCSTNN